MMLFNDAYVIIDNAVLCHDCKSLDGIDLDQIVLPACHLVWNLLHLDDYSTAAGASTDSGWLSVGISFSQ